MSRPYFETKIIKVGKPKPKLFRCRACGTILPKGNWIGSENLDEIKFPCFCTHKDKSNGYSGYGMLIENYTNRTSYMLIDIGKQRDEVTTVSEDESLKELIENWDVHILKGKIIIYEEE